MKIQLNVIEYDEENGEKYIEIVKDGERVGDMTVITSFEDADGYCYVERIDIDEQYRRQGIGTEVLTHALYDEFGWECRTVVVAPDNADAQRLYERIGRECTTADFPCYDQGWGVYEI